MIPKTKTLRTRFGIEIGELTGHAMPICRTVLGLVRQRARVAGVY